MNRLAEINNLTALAALAFGLYSAGKAIWYSKTGQGCVKCETFGLVAGLGLAGLGGYALFQNLK